MPTYGYALKINDTIRLPVIETREGAAEAHGSIVRWLIEEDGGVLNARIVRVKIEESPE